MGTSPSTVNQGSQNTAVNLPPIDTHARVDTLLRTIGDSRSDSPLGLDAQNNVVQLQQPGPEDRTAYQEALKAIQKKIGANETGQWDGQSQSALNTFASNKGASPMRALTGLAWDIRIERQTSRRQLSAAAYEAQTGFKAELQREENKEVMAAINELQHARNGGDVRKIDLVKHRDDLDSFKGAKQEIFDKKQAAEQTGNQSIDDLKSKRDTIYQTILTEQAAAKASSDPTDHDKHLIAAKKAKDELSRVNHAISDGSVGNNAIKKSVNNYDSLQKKLDQTLQVEHPEKITDTTSLKIIKDKLSESIEVASEAKRITDKRIAQLETHYAEDKPGVMGKLFEDGRIATHKAWNYVYSRFSDAPLSQPLSISKEYEASLKHLRKLQDYQDTRLKQLNDLHSIANQGEQREASLRKTGKTDDADRLHRALRENFAAVDISYRGLANDFNNMKQEISAPLRNQQTNYQALLKLKDNENTSFVDSPAFMRASQGHTERAMKANMQQLEGYETANDAALLVATSVASTGALSYAIGKLKPAIGVVGTALGKTKVGQKTIEFFADHAAASKAMVAEKLAEKTEILNRSKKVFSALDEKLPSFKKGEIGAWFKSQLTQPKLNYERRLAAGNVKELSKEVSKIEDKYRLLDAKEKARRDFLKRVQGAKAEGTAEQATKAADKTSTGKPIVEKILDPSEDIAKTVLTIEKNTKNTSAGVKAIGKPSTSKPVVEKISDPSEDIAKTVATIMKGN